MCRCWLLLTSRHVKICVYPFRKPCCHSNSGFEVESTTNNKHDIQSRYVAKTMAYTGELFLMSCTYLLQDVHPRGDISLSEMLSHWFVLLANTLFLSCFPSQSHSVQCCFYTDGWRHFRLCTFYLVYEWCWKWDFWGLLHQQSKCHWE